MDFANQLVALANTVLAVIQRIGIGVFPLLIGVAVIANMMGGERAIRAVGATILVGAILLMILTNAAGVSNLVQHPTTTTTTTVGPNAG